ncbi:SGNH/GDSL hydrolase family protein [Donghicola sp.]|jgi:lysophospholipase L1-like esterase|uniref:SGNH/GDSL hydrolase family protein n=1 Tax=Donghicola sp. TaxID=1929294 RepID=UPI0025E53235|nr:SGNH/GDSL hydrolase family protein [Donghicola sp.]MCT4575890.1 SGNH/GDSL hydrolase family protein [Donghicola sp.]
MTRILAFGDSLTWGHKPEDGTRHPAEFLWPNVLQQELGVEVISEGLGGRTTVFDDHSGPCCRNGAKVLPILLHSHSPLDLVIVMLGTNDLKPTICGRAEGATAGMKRLAQIIRTHPYEGIGQTPEVLLVSPPPCVIGPDGVTGGGRDVAETQRLAPTYQQLALDLGVAFFDAGTVATTSAIDGVHLPAKDTASIGSALAAPVRELLNL